MRGWVLTIIWTSHCLTLSTQQFHNFAYSYRDATPPSWFVWRGWGVLFPVLSVKKRRRKKNRERGRERERQRQLQRPLGIGLWLCSRRARAIWSERRKEEREGGFHFPSYRSPNSYSHCQGGNSQSGTHLGQNSLKTPKIMIAEA